MVSGFTHLAGMFALVAERLDGREELVHWISWIGVAYIRWPVWKIDSAPPMASEEEANRLGPLTGITMQFVNGRS